MELFVVFFNSIAVLFYPVVFTLFSLIVAFIVKRLRVIIIVLLILLLYFFSNGTLVEPILSNLEASYQKISNEEILTHQALILLGGGISKVNKQYMPSILSYSRILEAYRIYHYAKLHGVNYTIFITGGNTSGSADSESNVYKTELIKLGVPAGQIITEEQSLNTFDSARNMAFINKKHDYTSYLLVTSGYHMKRSLYYFKYFDLNIVPAPSDYISARVSLIPRAYNLSLLELAIHEYIGMARLKVYHSLGLND
ncbi:YdcF family protein [Thiotrichales bacterium 19S9-12]|nr:YdcF family protein [Thiotrichales bacterium 19S9-11]MCF6812216.1 YdcF family protein [Thiotrichales bacterium 19S9-12]